MNELRRNQDPALPTSPWRWPAEWEPHEATWLAWPHNPETWPHNLSAAQDEFQSLIQTIAECETVRLLVSDKSREQVVSRQIDRIPNVELWPIPTNDAWIRDYGPTVVHHRELDEIRIVDWTYNAWGEKYPPFDDDQKVAKRCARRIGCESTEISYVVEGGAIEGNGLGTIVTTNSCLLARNRQLNVKQAELDQCFARELGAQQVIWLPGGDIAGDDTDGHIDQIARFVDPLTLIVGMEPDPHDANQMTFQLNRRALEEWNERHGAPLQLVDIPMPQEVTYRSVRLPASYVNFIWVNEHVIVPEFGVPHDSRARGILQDLIPDRKVISLPCRHLAVGLGAWHCLSQPHARRIG